MSQMELPLAFRELPVCDGCGQPIEGEPYTHHSALNVHFITHDWDCLMVAFNRRMRELRYAVENPQHDDLERGIHD